MQKNNLEKKQNIQKIKKQQRNKEREEQKKQEKIKERQEQERRNKIKERQEQERRNKIKERQEQERRNKIKERQEQEKRDKIQEYKKQKKIEKIKERQKQENIREIKNRQKQEEKRRQLEAKKAVSMQDIKKIRRIKLIIKNFVAAIFIIFLIALFLLSPVFNIKNIEVTENSKISTDTIISLLQVNDETNIFKLSYKNISEMIKKNAYIKSVKVNKILPSTLKITVSEREPSFQLEFGSSYVLVDDEGYILEILKNAQENMIKITGYETSEELIIPGNRLCQNDLKKLDVASKIINIAKNYELANIITKIIFEDNDEYSLYIESEGKTVHLGKNVDFEIKMLYTKEILSRTEGEEGDIFVNMDLNEKNPYFRLKT